MWWITQQTYVKHWVNIEYISLSSRVFAITPMKRKYGLMPWYCLQCSMCYACVDWWSTYANSWNSLWSIIILLQSILDRMQGKLADKRFQVFERTVIWGCYITLHSVLPNWWCFDLQSLLFVVSRRVALVQMVLQKRTSDWKMYVAKSQFFLTIHSINKNIFIPIW